MASSISVNIRRPTPQSRSVSSLADDDDEEDHGLPGAPSPSVTSSSADISDTSEEWQGIDEHDYRDDIEPSESASRSRRSASREPNPRSLSQRRAVTTERVARPTAPRSHHQRPAAPSTIADETTEEFPSYGRQPQQHPAPFPRTPAPGFNQAYMGSGFNSNPFSQSSMIPYSSQPGYGQYQHNPFSPSPAPPSGGNYFNQLQHAPPSGYEMMHYGHGAAYGYGYPPGAGFYQPPVQAPAVDPEAEFKKKMEEMEKALKAATLEHEKKIKAAEEEKEKLRLEGIAKAEAVRKEQEEKEKAEAARKEKERQAQLERELEAKKVAEQLAFAKAKAEADGRAKAEAEAKAKVEAELEMARLKEKIELEGRHKAMQEALAKKEAEAAAAAEKARKEAEIRAKVEAELKEKAEAAAAAAAEAKKQEAEIRAKVLEEVKKKQEAEAKKAADEAEAKKKADEEAKKLADALAAAAAGPKDDKKKQVRFKDAVGRKFSFPYEICQKWSGMEELIKQAFLHVDIIGPEVQQGHYDLIGPNGEIILPQVWETMIEPDWAITMVMWPPPEKPKLIPGHGHGHGHGHPHIVNADPRVRPGRHGRAGIPLRPGGGLSGMRAGPPPPPPHGLRTDQPPAVPANISVVGAEKKKRDKRSSTLGWFAGKSGSKSGKGSKKKTQFVMSTKSKPLTKRRR